MVHHRKAIILSPLCEKQSVHVPSILLACEDAFFREREISEDESYAYAYDPFVNEKKTSRIVLLIVSYSHKFKRSRKFRHAVLKLDSKNLV